MIFAPRCPYLRPFSTSPFDLPFYSSSFTSSSLLIMASGDQQQFCLRWNDFQTNMVSSFKHLRDEKSFTDVTLACDGQVKGTTLRKGRKRQAMSFVSLSFRLAKPTRWFCLPVPRISRPFWRRIRPNIQSSSSRTSHSNI